MVKLNDRYGRLIVTNYNGCFEIHCRCDCGNDILIKSSTSLLSGRTKSCGCLLKEVNTGNTYSATHGKSKTPEWKAWSRIKDRCYNENTDSYAYYGGRGIRICDRWLDSFENFLEDMGQKPSKNHSIDRIDPDKGYEPGNCRWATSKEQGRNKRNNRLLTYRGQTKPMSQWCDELGLKYATVKSRLNVTNWSVDRALSTPTGSRKN